MHSNLSLFVGKLNAWLCVVLLAGTILVGLTTASLFCPNCPANDASIGICAIQFWSPHLQQNFTQCQLALHNCLQPLNRFTQVLPTPCPTPGAPLTCGAVPCNSTFAPVCGESIVTKRKTRYNNVCLLQLDSCQHPQDPIVNLGNTACKNWLNKN